MIRFVVTLVTLAACVCAQAVPFKVGAYTHLEGYSEPVPIQQMIDGWEETGVGEVAQAKARIGLGAITYVRFWDYLSLDEFGLERRWDYHLEFSRDTARFYSILENQGLAPGEYPLDLDVNAVEGRALYFKFKSVMPAGVLATAKLNVIEAHKFQNGSLKGVGEVLADESYSFEYDLDYQYSRNQLLNQSVSTSKAYGHSLDLDLEAHISSDWYLNAGVKDAFYNIYWKDVASSEGCLFRQRQNLTFCDQNFVQDSRKDFTQTLPSDAYANVRFRQFGVGIRKWGKETYLPVHVYFYPFVIEHDIAHQSVAVQWKANEFREVSIGLDNIDVQQAKVWRLNLRYFWL